MATKSTPNPISIEDTKLSLPEIWLNYVERPLDAVGLLQSPLRRFTAVTLGTAGILYIIKPRSLYSQDGTPYPIALMNPKENKSVPVNWIFASLFMGVLSVLFV